jgi:hypothetical protein
VWVIVFDTSYEVRSSCPILYLLIDSECKVCLTRLKEREGHPTITSYDLAIEVLARFSSDFVPPSPDEGYEKILNLKSSDYPFATYSSADILKILQDLDNSPPVTKQTAAYVSFASYRRQWSRFVEEY